MPVPKGFEHAGGKALTVGARTRLFERVVVDQPGAGRFREFRVRHGRGLDGG